MNEKNGGITVAVQAQDIRYCENCKEKTTHIVNEDALELEYKCTQCNETTEVVKNFF